SGSVGISPRVVFRPSIPVHAAGTRIDPAPSLPTAAPTSPAATAAALPPLEPPGGKRGSHGLRVFPHVGVSVNGHWVNSGTFVLPITIAPAARSRRTISASARAGGP